MEILHDKEIELLKAYLVKDHAWRTGAVNVPKRAIVDDNWSHQERSARFGWRLAPNVGAEQITSDDFNSLGQPNNDGALFAYGGGSGSITINGESTPYVMYDPAEGMNGFPFPDAYPSPYYNLNAVFNFVFGSYVGNWWKPNSLMRGLLADPLSTALTAVWSDRPMWHIHEMATGEPIGTSLLTTINNNGTYEQFSDHARQPHVSLLGDPTLRQAVVKPVTNVQFSTRQIGSGQGAQFSTRITWSAPDEEDIAGYYVYKSTLPDGPFVPMSVDEETHEPLPTSETYFLDTSTPTVGQDVYYMVRAAKLEESPSGTYRNLSTGTIKGGRRSVTISSYSWTDAPHRIIFTVGSGITLSDLSASISGLKWNHLTEEFDYVEFTSGTDFSLSYNSTSRKATVQFNGQSEFGVANTLPSGRYTVSFSANVQVSGGLMPSNFDYDIIFVAGDTNNDGIVNFTDLLVVTQHQGWDDSNPGYTEAFYKSSFGIGDFDNDGDVDEDDLDLVAELYGLDLNP